MSVGQSAVILGVVGIILGGTALGVTLTRAGPIGPIGPIGVQGPHGNGTVVATHSHESGFPRASATCTLWAYANISINVTGPGVVAIQGEAQILINHTVETEDIAYVYIQNGSSPCSGANTVLTIPSNLPSTILLETVPVQGVFTVSGYGEDTFTVMDMAASGADIAFSYISLVAVYYPG